MYTVRYDLQRISPSSKGLPHAVTDIMYYVCQCLFVCVRTACVCVTVKGGRSMRMDAYLYIIYIYIVCLGSKDTSNVLWLIVAI